MAKKPATPLAYLMDMLYIQGSQLARTVHVDRTIISRGNLKPLTTNVKDIVVTNVEEGNPYNLKVNYKAVKNGAEYVGVMGEHAQGAARFPNKESISLTYDPNDEVDYFLPTNLYDKSPYIQDGSGYQAATAWGSLTLAEDTPRFQTCHTAFDVQEFFCA